MRIFFGVTTRRVLMPEMRYDSVAESKIPDIEASLTASHRCD